MGKILARQKVSCNNVKPDSSQFASTVRHQFDKPYVVELAFAVESMSSGFKIEVYEDNVFDPFLVIDSTTPIENMKVRLGLAHDGVTVITRLTLSSGPVEDAVFSYVVSAVHE